MGTFIVFLTIVFLLLGFAWYKAYAQKRASQDSALIYALERLVAVDKELTSDNLLTELKDIVVERDGLIKDRFQSLIEEADVLDIDGALKMEDFFRNISDILSKKLNLDPKVLFRKFVEREKESSTVVTKGLAIPHIVVEGAHTIKALLVRAKAGIIFSQDKVVHIMFVLVGSSDERVLHLKILAAIAQITQNPGFYEKWLEVTNKEELKNLVLLGERRRG